MTIHYILGVQSFQIQTPETITTLLQTSILREVLFPACIVGTDGQMQRFEHAGEFSWETIPAEFLQDTGTNFTLEADNGMTFAVFCSRHSHESLYSFRSVFSFDSTHLQERRLSLPILKQIFADQSQAIDLDSGMLTDRANWTYRSNPKILVRVYRLTHLLQLGWMFYFGREWLATLGRERFSRLPGDADQIEMNGGVLVVFQAEPFDAHNLGHRTRETSAIEALGLHTFQIATSPSGGNTP